MMNEDVCLLLTSYMGFWAFLLCMHLYFNSSCWLDNEQSRPYADKTLERHFPNGLYASK